MSTIRNVMISGLAGVGIVTAGTFALDNTTRNDSGVIVEEGQLGVFSLEVGDCVMDFDWVQEEASETVGVPCSQNHLYEVFYETYLSDASLAEITESAQTICLENFQQYVGLSYEESVFEVTHLVPTQEGFEEGDQEITCLLHNPDGSLKSGSARGSQE